MAPCGEYSVVVQPPTPKNPGRDRGAEGDFDG